MPPSVIILGGGGHAAVVESALKQTGCGVAAVLDDSLAPGTKIIEAEVLGLDVAAVDQHRTDFLDHQDLRMYFRTHDGYVIYIRSGALSSGGGRHFDISAIRRTASADFSGSPKAVNRKYPSPPGPKPLPGVPTTAHFSSSVSKKSKERIPAGSRHHR